MAKNTSITLGDHFDGLMPAKFKLVDMVQRAKQFVQLFAC